MLNFYASFYDSYREELVCFGLRFDKTIDTAEDLFEEAHQAICSEYPALEPLAYQKLMRTVMGNKYRDKLRKEGYLDGYPFKHSLSPKPFPPLDEVVCRREEIELMRQAMARLSSSDQEILLREGNTPVITSWMRYQAIKRLEKKVIEVIVDQKSDRENLESVTL